MSKTKIFPLILMAAKALNKPGIDRAAVFGRASRRHSDKAVFAYSVYGADPSRFVREAADGTKVVGKVVNGKFKIVRD
jgi:hypothetical protein